MRNSVAALIVFTSLAACGPATERSRAQGMACDWSIEPLLTPPGDPKHPASPFPSDLYTVEADTPTGFQNNVTGQGIVFQELINHQDGWAPHGPIRIAFSGTITSDTLPKTITDSTDASAAIQIIHVDTLERLPYRWKLGIDQSRVYLIPFRPMLEEARYAIVIRKNIKPSQAQCVDRTRGYQKVLGGLDGPYAPHIAASLRSTYDALKRGAKKLKLDPLSIALATPYTTLSVTRAILAKRDLVYHEPITAYGLKSYNPFVNGHLNTELDAKFPSLPADLSFEKDVHFGNIAYLVIGHYTTSDFRSECNIPYGIYKWVDSAQCQERIEFLLTLPKISTIRPEYRANVLTDNRFPVVIFGHGLTACKETGLAVANLFAEYGIAVIGIDVVEHGTRNHSDPGVFDIDGKYVRGDSCGETLAEGLRIIRGADPEIARDNFRQTVLDEVQLVQMMAGNPDLNYLGDTVATDSTGLLRVSNFGYIGQSLGGMLGTVLTTIEPRIRAAVLNVPGGGISSFVVAAKEGAYSPFDIDSPDGLLYETIAGVQTIIGPADPLYYAPYASGATPASRGLGWPQKNILIQEGTRDDVMPKFLTEDLARGFGAVNAKPVQYDVEGLPQKAVPYRGDGSATFAMQQFEVKPRPEGAPPGTKDWTGHYFLSVSNYPNVVSAAQEQAARFLWTGMFEDKAEVVDGFKTGPYQVP